MNGSGKAKQGETGHPGSTWAHGTCPRGMGALEEMNQLKPAMLDVPASGGHREAEAVALGSSFWGGGTEAEGLEALHQGPVTEAEDKVWLVLPRPPPHSWLGPGSGQAGRVGAGQASSRASFPLWEPTQDSAGRTAQGGGV